MIFNALSRSIWYSLLVSVWDGHTTIESPVCIPTGSKFSILQTVIAVSLASRITSYSISLKPLILFSIKTWWTGDKAMAFLISSVNSFSSSAKPPPVPPRVNAGRSTTGYPIFSAALTASSIVFAITDGSTGSPSSSQSFLNCSLSSARSILSLQVPKSSTWHSFKTPFFSSCIARFSPVCPPIPGTMASGRSWRTIFATYSSVSGSIYTLSATVRSVIMVAGLELHSTTS